MEQQALGLSAPALSATLDGMLANDAAKVPKTRKRKSAAASPLTSPQAAATASPSALPSGPSDAGPLMFRSNADRLRAERTKFALAESTRAEAVRDEINLVDSDENTGSSSEDEDSLFESPQSKRRRNRQRLRGGPARASAAARCISRPRLQKPQDISTPLSGIQQTCLDQIERREDKNLLRLFWAHGWSAPVCDTDLDMSTAKCFVFLNHQFMALRFVAGVPEAWPQAYPPENWPSASLDGCMHGDNPWKPGGGILGDMMGLGKTIELLGGAFLREILHAHHDFPAKSRTTMIVLPNDPVSDQWREAAIKAGISANEIGVYTGKDGVLPNATCSAGMATRYTLTTIHRLQADAKRVFDLDSWGQSDDEPGFKYIPSPLALQLTAKSALWLKMKYLDNKAKNGRAQIPEWLRKLAPVKKRPFAKKGPKEIIAAELRKRHGADIDEAVAVVSASRAAVSGAESADHGRVGPTYLTFIIDEAHLMRNDHAYWSLLAIAMGAEAQRVIPATGTPFNNAMQDMATLEAFIDPRRQNTYNRADWWKNAFGPAEVLDATPLSKEENDRIMEQVKQWRQTGFLRRDHSVLTRALPKRTDIDICVVLGDPELGIYRVSEAALVRLFRRLHMLSNATMHAQTKLRRQRKLLMQTLAMIMVADMELLHPVLSNQGREVTKLFSPSRSQYFETDRDKQLCVVCSNGKLRTSTAAEPLEDTDEHAGEDDEQDSDLLSTDSSSGEDEGDHDDDSSDEDQGQHLSPGIAEAKRNPHPVLGKLIPMPRTVCGAQRGPGGLSSHWCHEKCVEGCVVARACPRCELLKDMLGTGAVTHGNGPVGIQMGTDPASSQQGFQPRMCADVAQDANGVSLPGFVPSTKLLALQQQLCQIDLKQDKVIVFSKFRGFLDLVEAMLHHEMRVQVERFDGDEDKVSKARALTRFCSKPEGRVLLATVQSGGVGLNITAANHVIFCDRWFNPMIHEQAICRAHRLGQTKPVRVVYLDADDTINSVIKNMMLTKLSNANKILRDGTDVGSAGGGGNGMGLDAARTMGSMMTSLIHSRHTSAGASGQDGPDSSRTDHGRAVACTPSRGMAPKRERSYASYNKHCGQAGRTAKKDADGAGAVAATTKPQCLIVSDEDSEEEQLLARSTQTQHVASVKSEPVHEEINLVDSDDDF